MKDVLRLAPILNQLKGLMIPLTCNGQVPYLLRRVLPNGLPNLKKLCISQTAVHQSTDGLSQAARNERTVGTNREGSSWYETVDGAFNSLQDARLTIFENYLHSIARGAPNLEELGFYGHYYQLSQFVSASFLYNNFAHEGLIYSG